MFALKEALNGPYKDLGGSTGCAWLAWCGTCATRRAWRSHLQHSGDTKHVVSYTATLTGRVARRRDEVRPAACSSGRCLAPRPRPHASPDRAQLARVGIPSAGFCASCAMRPKAGSSWTSEQRDRHRDAFRSRSCTTPAEQVPFGAGRSGEGHLLHREGSRNAEPSRPGNEARGHAHLGVLSGLRGLEAAPPGVAGGEGGAGECLQPLHGRHAGAAGAEARHPEKLLMTASTLLPARGQIGARDPDRAPDPEALRANGAPGSGTVEIPTGSRQTRVRSRATRARGVRRPAKAKRRGGVSENLALVWCTHRHAWSHDVCGDGGFVRAAVLVKGRCSARSDVECL